jgi:hypothetical protein
VTGRPYGPGLDVLHLGTEASAVEDSCYVGFGSQPIEHLTSVEVRARGWPSLDG